MGFKKLWQGSLFYQKIVLNDEAYFWLNGYINRQNCRIRSGSVKCTVCYDLWSEGIYGPYFFKYEDVNNVTVNGYRFLAMISNFLVPKIPELNLVEFFFCGDTSNHLFVPMNGH